MFTAANMVDAFVVAKRRFCIKPLGVQQQVEQLCFFADAALSSVVELQYRIRALRSVHPHALSIVVTCRTGMAIEPLLGMDRVFLVSPAEPSSRPEELPDEWYVTDGEKQVAGTLDQHGFRFPCAPTYPALCKKQFAEAAKVAGREPRYNETLVSGFDALL